MASCQLLIADRARAGTARIAARAACACGFAGLRFLTAGDGEAGELLREPLALAFGACGLLASQHDRFKPVLALLAYVFEDRHKARLK